jgi:hypothetical protein
MADIPGGASGLLVRDYKGKADRLVTRIAPRAVSLVAELRGHERAGRRGTGPGEDRRRGAQAPRRLAGGDQTGCAPWGACRSIPRQCRGRRRRPRMDGVIGWSRSRAVASGSADGRPNLSRFPPLEPGPDPRPARRGHGRSARRHQRVAGAATERERKPTSRRPGSIPAWSRWSRNSAATSAEELAVEDAPRGAQGDRRLAVDDHAGAAADRRAVGLVGGGRWRWRNRGGQATR